MAEKKEQDEIEEAKKKTLLDFFKALFIVSLPHLALILIFLIYLLIGASIIQEIDICNKNDQQPVVFKKFEDRVRERLNSTRDFEKENKKALEFLKKLVRTHKKNVDNNGSSNDTIYSQRLVKTFLEYKQEMQLNLFSLMREESAVVASTDEFKFKNSFYFAITLLTAIGEIFIEIFKF